MGDKNGRHATSDASGEEAKMRLVIMTLVLAMTGMPALAANTPCSGKKGGISHCRGDKFVCKDGSTSASKKKCSGYSKE